MRMPPTAFQKMRHRRLQAAELHKRQELARIARQVAAERRQTYEQVCRRYSDA